MTDKYEALRKSLADVAKGATLSRIHTFRDHADIDTIRALLAERDALRAALVDLIGLAEASEVQIDGEWGDCRTIEQIERGGELPSAIIDARAALAQGEKNGTPD